MARLALPTVNRDVELERRLTSVVALAVGLAHTTDNGVVVQPVVDSLTAFAEQRAWPGEIVIDGRDRSLMVEAAEELADCRSYLLWIAQTVLDRAEAGDANASDEYGRAMRALGLVLEAWQALTSA